MPHAIQIKLQGRSGDAFGIPGIPKVEPRSYMWLIMNEESTAPWTAKVVSEIHDAINDTGELIITMDSDETASCFTFTVYKDLRDEDHVVRSVGRLCEQFQS